MNVFFVCIWRHNLLIQLLQWISSAISLFLGTFWNSQPCSTYYWQIEKAFVSNGCAIMHVFWHVNQDGGQLQTTYCTGYRCEISFIMSACCFDIMPDRSTEQKFVICSLCSIILQPTNLKIWTLQITSLIYKANSVLQIPTKSSISKFRTQLKPVWKLESWKGQCNNK